MNLLAALGGLMDFPADAGAFLCLLASVSALTWHDHRTRQLLVRAFADHPGTDQTLWRIQNDPWFRNMYLWSSRHSRSGNPAISKAVFEARRLFCLACLPPLLLVGLLLIFGHPS